MVTIVTSHWKEDLEWLKKSEFPVVLIDKEGSDPSWLQPTYIIPNIGNESTVYLRFIIERYHDLPEYTAFIHGHETSWHQNYNLLDCIRNANYLKYKFIPLNSVWKDGVISDTINNSQWHLQEAWDTYMENFDNPFILRNIPACGQFIVSKDRILLHPLELYKSWYDKFMSRNIFYDCIFFEFIWHFIFGESTCYNIPIDLFSINIDNFTEHRKLVKLDVEPLYKISIKNIDMY